MDILWPKPTALVVACATGMCALGLKSLMNILRSSHLQADRRSKHSPRNPFPEGYLVPGRLSRRTSSVQDAFAFSMKATAPSKVRVTAWFFLRYPILESTFAFPPSTASRPPDAQVRVPLLVRVLVRCS